MNRNKRTIFLVVSILREAIVPLVAYENSFKAERKARELDENRLAGDKAQYVVHSIELVEEK
jgi:hypothetical protein